MVRVAELKALVARLRTWADELGDLSNPVLYEDYQRQYQADLRAAADYLEELITVSGDC